MNRKIKRLSILVFSMVLSVFFNTNMLSAKEIDVPVHSQQRACEAGTMYPIPDKGEVILLEDNSTIEPLYRSEISALSDVNRAASRINVNKSYSIRIQDQGGSCVSSAKVTVTGAYTYNNGKISNVSLNAAITYVPTLWTVSINSQWHNISGSSLTHSINYRSSVNDPYSCLVGGGYWYSGATIKIR